VSFNKTLGEVSAICSFSFYPSQKTEDQKILHEIFVLTIALMGVYPIYRILRNKIHFNLSKFKWLSPF